MKFPDFIKSPGISAARVRLEIFALGGRHQGDPLAGALRELQEAGLDNERRSLLRAVVAQLGKGKPRGAKALQSTSSGPLAASLSDVIYIVVIIAAAVWTAVMISSMNGS